MSDIAQIKQDLLMWAGLHRGKAISEKAMPRFHEIIDTMDKLSTEINQIKQEERDRILTQFCIAGSALTMYQTNPSIHWTAQQLLQEMRRICGIEENKQ